MAKTRHYASSQQPDEATRRRLARIRDERLLPSGDVTPSTARMLETLDRIISGGEALRYEANKVADWMARFPLKPDAAKIERWQSWPDQERIWLIADAVMLHGWTSNRTALVYHTTRQTVDDIVKTAREKIRRSL